MTSESIDSGEKRVRENHTRLSFKIFHFINRRLIIELLLSTSLDRRAHSESVGECRCLNVNDAAVQTMSTRRTPLFRTLSKNVEKIWSKLLSLPFSCVVVVVAIVVVPVVVALVVERLTTVC